MRILSVLAFLCAATITLVVDIARADIILDDFTDAAFVESPAMEDDFVESANVGDLMAQRAIRIASSGGHPVGTFDVNVTWPGQMTAHVAEIVASPSIPFPLTAPQFNYKFETADITEGGRNDAILFDFAELSGEVQPTFLRAWVFDDTHVGPSFIFEIQPLVQNASPHTLVAPFDQFMIRGGGSLAPDPTTLREIRFDFFFFGHAGELNWSARLERIRFGRAIPEPNTLLLSLVSVFVYVCFPIRAAWGAPIQSARCLALSTFYRKTGYFKSSFERLSGRPIAFFCFLWPV